MCTYMLPWWFSNKESVWNAGDPGWFPGPGRSFGEGIGYLLQYSWASLVAQLVKKPPIMWETWVQSLSWEDPLEEALSTHFSILAWRIPMDKSAWSMGSHRVRNYWMTTKACKLCLWISFRLLVQLYFRVTLVPFSSVAQSCPTLCKSMDWSSQASLSITSCRASSNSCPSSWCCHPTILSSILSFSYCLQSFLASGSYTMSKLLTSGCQSIVISASASVLPMNIQDFL